MKQKKIFETLADFAAYYPDGVVPSTEYAYIKDSGTIKCKVDVDGELIEYTGGSSSEGSSSGGNSDDTLNYTFVVPTDTTHSSIYYSTTDRFFASNMEEVMADTHAGQAFVLELDTPINAALEYLDITIKYKKGGEETVFKGMYSLESSGSGTWIKLDNGTALSGPYSSLNYPNANYCYNISVGFSANSNGIQRLKIWFDILNNYSLTMDSIEIKRKQY